ncbi:MAG TPA: hypothetical protein VFZ53_34430 [Polyangiaceae bacterium]
MPRAPFRDRTQSLLTTARTNPEFGLRIARELSPSAREVFVSELAKPERVELRPAAGPGLAKCVRSPYANECGFAAQLRLVAKSAARVR